MSEGGSPLVGTTANDVTETDKVHIRVQQCTGTQCITTLQGLTEPHVNRSFVKRTAKSDVVDYSKLLAALSKSFGCKGKIVPDAKLGTVLELQGDQRINCLLSQVPRGNLWC